MRRPPALSVALGLFTALAACAPAVQRRDSGVAVGNPGNLRATVSTARSTELVDGVVMVDALALEGCAGEDQLVAESFALGLAEPGALLLPAGEWCGLWLEGVAVELELDNELFAVAETEALLLQGDSVRTDNAVWQLRIGPADWLDEEALEELEGERDEDGFFVELPAEDLDESTVFLDAAGDGLDLEDAVLLSSDNSEEELEDDEDWSEEGEEAPESRGCATAGAGSGLAGAWALGLALLARRQRWRRRRSASQAPRRRS